MGWEASVVAGSRLLVTDFGITHFALIQRLAGQLLCSLMASLAYESDSFSPKQLNPSLSLTHTCTYALTHACVCMCTLTEGTEKEEQSKTERDRKRQRGGEKRPCGWIQHKDHVPAVSLDSGESQTERLQLFRVRKNSEGAGKKRRTYYLP